ncbi:replication-associated recombination protein A [Spiroplasma tabanidicola]|uniref:Recombination factor protein RarA n=1 Tax=Spiroplasma tabanidicola TaxID=324079 RepID=A0A6I6CCF4_9MOLU|nr:replication-associated recombination protein A [Spiroplasma tabanidicola]QGS51802.1 recombination factor protein RarA [Spiroplasma tabanidicola]
MDKALSFLLRPTTLKKVIGQTHLLNKNGIITKMVEKNFVANLIFYGPPGIGKTSTAISLANDLNCEYIQFNASKDKKETLIKLIELKTSKNKLILIIDEIHRMNRNIQDYLLEFLETREIVVFITTTENPYFVINPAIRSRCTVLQLNEISKEEMIEGIKKIIIDNDLKLDIDNKNISLISQYSNGDLRTALNVLEILENLYNDQKIDENLLKNIFDKANVKGTAEGDEYHDLKSAFQKSIRGSDVNAALHYWARLMEIGDYEIILRRMQVIAYEDIGLANPAIAQRVYLACQSFREIGMPEGIKMLGMAVIEMALSEKSNSAYLAIDAAISDVKSGNVPPIPVYLRDGHYASAVKLGVNGYVYPHNYENAWVDQQYLPDKIKNIKYFEFKPHSAYEKKLKEIYDKFTKKK